MEEESMPRKASVVFAACALAAALFLGAPVVAHHSISAEFDTNKPVKFTGTIKQVDWMNPHIYTHVEVKNPDGTSTVYKVEGGPPNSLYRQGWRKDTLKTGDVVTVSGVRAKNPQSMNVGVATIITQDGRRIFGAQGGGRGQAQQQ
jgi:DNA/RNA endonuclease YhcR with UshA esterase domain